MITIGEDDDGEASDSQDPIIEVAFSGRKERSSCTWGRGGWC